MFFLRQTEPNIRRYLPSFIFSDKAADAVAQASSSEHEALRLAVEDVANQFYVETATWGLADWERVLGISTIRDSFAIRRNRILLRLQSNQISTIDFLCALVQRYVENNTVKIEEHNEEYYFKVILRCAVIDFKGLREGLDLYKPAHLGLNIQLKWETEIKYNVGLIQMNIGKKRISLPQPPRTIITMSAGIAQLRIGRKRIHTPPPPTATVKLYAGLYTIRTGRVRIGGTK